MTHTFVLLDVSQTAYREVRELLEKAGYGHAFVDSGDGTECIDMQGIALHPDVASVNGAAKRAASRRRGNGGPRS